ncbi:hypothetical protein N7535_000598 [Penicillium sp. DV-2018c]|nr:hypothetical protein N7535_000598 [Penicillium sp. DV-2018c]
MSTPNPGESPRPVLTPHLLSQEDHADDYDDETGGEYDSFLDRPFEDMSRLEQLPPEILYSIASYLSAADLTRLGATCRMLANYAMDDTLWGALVNERLPFRIEDAGSFGTFRRLYLAYHPCWFLPQHKIWFADAENTGLLVIARYDHRRGVIEACELVADRQSSTFQVWESNPDVIIQTFDPRVHLCSDEAPAMLLQDPFVAKPALGLPSAPIEAAKLTSVDRYMPLALEMQSTLYGISFCTAIDSKDLRSADDNIFWPPRTIPRCPRAIRHCKEHPLLPEDALKEKFPATLDRMSEFHWRVTKGGARRMHTPDPRKAMLTFSTLDPALYTPTKENPYQGIWVGDYSAHGCEFLLVIQRPVNEVYEDEDWMDEYYWDDSDEEDLQVIENAHEYEPNSQEIVQQGRLEAIKLTGDSNVPRGQYSFVAKDIGPGGFLRVANDEPFAGARIVRSRGHLAGRNFFDHTYINGELILISPDYLAHYWKEMGHISYYRRVDIDALVRP